MKTLKIRHTEIPVLSISPLAISLKEWQEPKGFQDAGDAKTLGTEDPDYYLKNRLLEAYRQGYLAAEKQKEQL